MKENKENKVLKVKAFLDKNNVFYDERPNGHLLIGSLSLYATTESWYDSKTGKKGKGVSSCLAFMKQANLV